MILCLQIIDRELLFFFLFSFHMVLFAEVTTEFVYLFLC